MQNVSVPDVPPECPWIARNTRNVRKNQGSSSTETFSSVLLLLPRKLNKLQLAIAKYPVNFDSNNSAKSSNLTAPSSSR